MARIRSKNTQPEMIVRRALHSLGKRFRVHRTDLPGSPDIVLPRHRIVVFVHGCFWHRHPGCRLSSVPKTRVNFWTEKFELNVQRDVRKAAALQALGWRVVTVWECETRHRESLILSLEGIFHEGWRLGTAGR
ncbi:DNA mismatch endonuclease Vsr [Mesorhizobium sp. M0006]